MRIHITSFLVIVSLIPCIAQSKFKAKYLEPISAVSLKENVYALASDSLKGRATGSEGEHKAALFIRNQFIEAGLLPYNDTSYFQNIGLWSWRWDDFTFELNDENLSNYDDFVYLSSSPIAEPIEAPCVFIGNASDTLLNKIKLDGKIAFIIVDNLKRWYSTANKARQNGAIAVVMAHKNDPTSFHTISERLKVMHQKASIGSSKPEYPENSIKAFAVNSDLSKRLFGLSIDSLSNVKHPRDIKRLSSPELKLSCPLVVEKANANNVVAYLPGKNRDNEALVISAHYDHIGEHYNGICLGADDNASGTAAVIELAKAFAPLKGKLDKNIIFIATSGEEKGLLGAFYFADHADEHHFNLKANINIDMIGRLDSTHKANYIYTIGNNHYPEFDSLLHVANNMVEPLIIQYEYNKSQGFGNFLRLSDHYAFHRNNVPVMGFFSGLHADYHKPSDTPDKIDYQEMEKRVKLIFTTAYLAAQKTAFSSQTD
ncbi:M28 family metallopeptidase [Carboxylicivirga marina]|uniref:M28 family metallopeptidase n=1 Tax=Carboxylicivirga marina TaxID=2800988 RepID=UPI0025934515|nr:M20/M25/M40 family metallo-hydrolase [uncultured Carboxylicivirga sp.]